MRVLWIILLFGNSLAAQSWHFGLVGKGGLNVSKSVNENGTAARKTQSGISPGIGVYACKIPNGHLGYSTSVLLTRAKYDVQYSEGSNRFLDADIRFAEVNLNAELHILSSGNVRPFLFLGGQFLYRRYGEERFINAVIANSYWPSSRLNVQTGFGIHILDIGALSLHPFMGFRLNPSQELVYDTGLDQYFAGIAVAFAMEGKRKNPYNRCPDNF